MMYKLILVFYWQGIAATPVDGIDFIYDTPERCIEAGITAQKNFSGSASEYRPQFTCVPSRE